MHQKLCPGFETQFNMMLKERSGRWLAIAAAATLLLWFILQIVACIFYWGAPQYGDAAKYIMLGTENQWYPTAAQLHSESYIFNPGYVNFLIAFNKITGSQAALPIAGIVLNIVLLCSVVSVIYRLTDNVRTAMVAVILFTILPSNILSVVVVMSDLLFAAFVYFSIATFNENKKWLMVLSGASMAFANYVRPITIVFLFSMALFAFAKRYRLKPLLSFALSFALLTATIAFFNTQNSGHTFVAGSTGGVNLIIGANNDINGSYTGTVFEPGNPGYVDDKNLDVFSKDSLWKSRAIEWVKAHPAKYVAAIPKKIGRLWAGDTYHELVLQGHGYGVALKIIYSLPYYFILLMAAIGIWRHRRRLWGIWGIYLIPVVAACAMHALLYGGMRYHYPYMPILILFAADALSNCHKTSKNVSVK